MSYRAPKLPTPEKPADPLVNLGEKAAVIQKEKTRQGYLSTFMSADSKYATGNTNRLSNTLGNQPI